MARQIRHSRVWTLVSEQEGRVSRRQLLDLGYTRDAIAHRRATGRLVRTPFAGVFAVGRRDGSPRGLWWEALLAAGPDAVLSHLSAAQLFGLIRHAPELIHVSLLTDSHRSLRGIDVHRRASLQTTTFRGLPVTTPAETLVDLAATFAPDPLERAVDEADKLGLIDPERLRRHLDDIPARPGVKRLRTLLDRHTFRLTDSDLEQRMLRIIKKAGLPLPETRERDDGGRIDFLWPQLKLIVEVDGLTYHRTPSQQARDRHRDQLHAAAGLETLRFTDQQVRREPEHVEAVLVAVVARRAGGADG